MFFACPGVAQWQGYSWDFQLYYGKGSNFYTPASAANLTVSEEVVCKLMEELLGVGRHVILDNWYTSLRLANHLLEKNTTVTGVLNPTRPIAISRVLSALYSF